MCVFAPICVCVCGFRYTLFYIRTRILKPKLDVLKILAIWVSIVPNYVLNWIHIELYRKYTILCCIGLRMIGILWKYTNFKSIVYSNWNTIFFMHYLNCYFNFFEEKNYQFILIFYWFFLFLSNFPKYLSKSETELVLKMFLMYPKNRALSSYKLGSYNKKSVYPLFSQLR